MNTKACSDSSGVVLQASASRAADMYSQGRSTYITKLRKPYAVQINGKYLDNSWINATWNTDYVYVHGRVNASTIVYAS